MPHIAPHPAAVTPAQRQARMGQRPMVLWFTGLSGAGKTSLAQAVDAELHRRGMATALLDGDELRQGLCSGLGYSAADRAENIRRAGEVARLMVDAGLVVLAAFISPERAQRDAVRARLAPGAFHEVFVSTPLAVCEQRDPKGLYRLARAGELLQFTGVSAIYEAPLVAELVIDTTHLALQSCAGQIVDYVIAQQGII
jgi:adenylylsulfate kinase